jgi:hypothetical protein
VSLSEPQKKNFFTPPSPEDSPRKRSVSERKIQANRRNALRSTGPKTARGKHNVGCNAIKHGLLARQVVITAGDGEESLKEFHGLVGRLWESYEPVGVVEETLVQRIATCWWRLARVIRAENGETRKGLDSLGMDRFFRSSDQFNLAMSLLEVAGNGDLYSPQNQADRKVSTRGRLSALQGFQTDVRADRFDLAYLKGLLKKVKSEVESGELISDGTWRRVLDAFCAWDYLLTHTCLSACPPEAKVENRPSENVEDKQADKKRSDVVAFIDSRLERITLLEELASEREKLARDAEVRSLSLPPADATDKLLRYEAHLDRQLYRAMDQLERLQRNRRGENVPPPLNINLGTRN